jgi:hypothetical protein
MIAFPITKRPEPTTLLRLDYEVTEPVRRTLYFHCFVAYHVPYSHVGNMPIEFYTEANSFLEQDAHVVGDVMFWVKHNILDIRLDPTDNDNRVDKEVNVAAFIAHMLAAGWQLGEAPNLNS